MFPCFQQFKFRHPSGQPQILNPVAWERRAGTWTKEGVRSRATAWWAAVRHAGSEAGWALTTFLPVVGWTPPPLQTEICNLSLTRGNWRIKTQTCLVSLAHPEMPDAQRCRSEMPLRVGSGYLAVPEHSLYSWDLHSWICALLGSPDLGKYCQENLLNKNQSVGIEKR